MSVGAVIKAQSGFKVSGIQPFLHPDKFTDEDFLTSTYVSFTCCSGP